MLERRNLLGLTAVMGLVVATGVRATDMDHKGRVIATAVTAHAGTAEVTCNDPKGWTFDVQASEDGGRDVVTVRISSPTNAMPPQFGVFYRVPGAGVQNVWISDSGKDGCHLWPQLWWDWSAKYTSQLAKDTPIAVGFNATEVAPVALACSEAFEAIDFGLYADDRTCEIVGRCEFFVRPTTPIRTYAVSVLLDRRGLGFAETVRDCTAWISRQNGFRTADVPEAAYDPLYSTWYAYLQDVHDKELETEARHAAALGMKTMILDDGWQKVDSASFYSATGDWQPVPSRFPDMKAHVKAVQDAGLKYMLWLSVPYVGDESKAWDRFKDKLLVTHGKKSPGRIGVVDPRFPEVREYLISTYERVVGEWGFDGVKLDFIDQFALRGADPALKDNFAGRDYRSVPEAVDRLMKDILARLKKINPEVLVEFRQHYMGPAILQYGNMMRCNDCPADPCANRRRVCDLRLTSDALAVHSDMLVWSKDETSEGAALPILNVLFSTIQYSMILETIRPEHRAVIRHWLDFSQKHRAALLKGTFTPHHPENGYTWAEGESAAERIVVGYSPDVCVRAGKPDRPVFLVNATGGRGLLAEISEAARVRFFDVVGRPSGETTVRPGVARLDIPASGFAEVVWCREQQGAEAIVQVRADRATCRYELGEVAKLSVSLVDEKGELLRRGRVVWSVDNFGSVVVQTNTVVNLSDENPFTVSVTRSCPGFARLIVTAGDAEMKIRKNAGNPLDGYCYGLAFDAENIRSGTPDPEDFETFWKQAIDALDAEVAPDIRLEPMAEQSTETMSCFRVSVASAGGRRVYGWLTEPKDLAAGPYPVRIRVPGAGIGFLGPVFCDGAICLSMNVHSYAQPEGESAASAAERQRLYEEQDRVFAAPMGVRRYCQAGVHLSREQYFYYASILGVNRAITWLAQRPECDLEDFTYSGTSQGGGFGLYLTALNPHITRSVICVPALTDLLGYKIEGRQSGWPQVVESQRPENRAGAERWAPYFCGVNFARRITVPIRFVVGFSDCVCSPNAVLSAFNACASKDKVLYDGIGMGHRVFDDFYGYLDAWEKSGAASEPKYRFLAFNIWGDYFSNPPHERDAREADLIRRWNPDFVALQEVTPNFWKSQLIAQMEKEYVVLGRGLGPGKIDSYVPVAFRRSRFNLVESGAEGFCPEIDTSKGVVWAVVEDRTSARRFVVFSSHFWWQKKGVADDWVRLDNARRLSERLQEIADRHGAGIIGGGDLNAPVESWAMKHLVSVGLADAQQTADLSPRMVRTHHVNPVRDAKGAYYGVPAVRGISEKVSWLDHIFYDPSRIRALRFEIDMSAEACSLSDHHPICVDFN